MIVPSYTGFASTPDAAGAFLGGAQLSQRSQIANQEHQAQMAAIAQRSQEASMQHSLGLQRIAQERAEAELNNQARQSALQQEVLQKAQQLEIEKAYQQSMIGLKQQDLERQQEKANLEAQQAAQQFQSRQRLALHAQNALATGEASSPAEALSQAALQFGMDSGFSGAEMANITDFRGGAGGAESMGSAKLEPVEGTDEYDFFQTGPNSRQLVKRTPEIPEGATDIPGTGYQRIGERVVPKREDASTKELREDRKRLRDALEGKDTMRHRMAIAKTADPKAKLSAVDKYYIEQYKTMQSQLADIETKLKQGSSARPSGGTTNTIGRFKVY